MKIEIDEKSGFCNGVVRSIKMVEQQLIEAKHLYCLGNIVHNSEEVNRLINKGLEVVDKNKIRELKNETVLIRAHGEPPETYELANRNGLNIIDASCGVVLALQQKIKKSYFENPNAQIVIYGKKGHAEVIGLEGQINYEAIVVESEEDLDVIDFSKPVYLFSQTTMSLDSFNAIAETIETKMFKDVEYKHFDTICRQVSNRIPDIKQFASRFDLIIFVSGKNSSNGKVLYEVCANQNPNTVLVSSIRELDFDFIRNFETIGICGATSTPVWLMQNIKKEIEKKLNI